MYTKRKEFFNSLSSRQQQAGKELSEYYFSGLTGYGRSELITVRSVNRTYDRGDKAGLLRPNPQFQKGLYRVSIANAEKESIFNIIYPAGYYY